MAGEWIPWTKGLTHKREIFAIARTLKIDRRIAACLCMETWEWADSETSDGQVTGITIADLDTIARTPGFGLAMIDVGWIVETRRGLTFTNWERWNTDSAKNRLRERERKRRKRADEDAKTP